jgi:FKBP-type peptidyl-prolyl cis-trans isomerase 2
MKDMKVLTLIGGSSQVSNGYYSDINFDSTGEVIQVEGKARINQDVIKSIMTLRGNTLYLPNYGSRLSALSGTRMDVNTQNAIVSEILFSLSYLTTMQPSPTLVGDDEVITSVDDVLLEKDKSDERSVVIRAIIGLKSGNTLSLSMR